MRTIGVGLIGAGYMGKRHTALLRMADGASGTIQVSRCAWGRTGRPQLQLFGARGAIVFDQERFNRVGLFVATRGAMGERGPQERQLTGPTIDVEHCLDIIRISAYILVLAETPGPRRSKRRETEVRALSTQPETRVEGEPIFFIFSPATL
jgi:predicted dehydrogenase